MILQATAYHVAIADGHVRKKKKECVIKGQTKKHSTDPDKTLQLMLAVGKNDNCMKKNTFGTDFWLEACPDNSSTVLMWIHWFPLFWCESTGCSKYTAGATWQFS